MNFYLLCDTKTLIVISRHPGINLTRTNELIQPNCSNQDQLLETKLHRDGINKTHNRELRTSGPDPDRPSTQPSY
jgi:hypothetical protein